MTFIRESVMRNMIPQSSFAILVEKSKEINSPMLQVSDFKI